ncbi:MAG: hypothetical protein PHY45_16955 [Rhodocyclaceae bacterium]|nr:hypothetical protein [Rhodocyclaceae bacterium]
MTIRTTASRFLGAISATLLLCQPVLGHADSGQAEKRQVQAMQFGLLFGGIATQYDKCVEKGYLPAGPQRAEDQADAYLKTAEQFARDAEAAANVQKGWDIAKRKFDAQDAKFWEANCPSIGKLWKRYEVTLKLQ